MDERERLEQAIAALEGQRTSLGDAVVEPMIAAAREKLAALKLEQEPPEFSGPAAPGERKLVTILFADISGFTALAERMDPEVVRELMNGCFDRLVPVIEAYGGTVDKFIGDEVMALFGAPVAHENDPERALRAALAMRDALTTFSAERDAELGIHFGVNTGLVIAGGIGSEGRQEYSVMGDAVNLAARLEEVSERGEILVGPDTYRLTAPLFEFELLEPVKVKGKAEPVPIHRLLAAKTAPGSVRGIAGLESPLVGREAELQALLGAVERLQDGEGGVVTLVGEAGLGKSRLAAEAREARGEGGERWVEGRCLSYGTSIAYLLWLDVLRGLVGMTAEDDPIAVRDALREQVQVFCAARADELYPYLGRLMSLPLEAEAEAVVQGLDGERLKAGIFQAMAELMECIANQQPLVLVCEDLHWADPTSLALLKDLFQLTERAAVLFVCLMRPEREHNCWRLRETVAQHHRHIDLWLPPLSTGESDALMGHLLRVEGLPIQLKERILSRAEGNPFYVEEIIRSLIDSGAIVYDETSGHWQATRDVSEISIPDTLHGVLMARIDRLQEETKRILQLAAVIGRIFFYRVLVAIAREERSLDEHLLALLQEELIRERAQDPERVYIFKHHLTREAAYNGLLKKERRRFHRRVAEALERFFAERVEEQVGLLAYHWEQAEAPEEAVKYLLRAGDQARLAYAHQEAADYYGRALAFLTEERQHEPAARTLMKLGLTYHNALDFQQSRQAYEEGFALWQRAGEMERTVLPPPAPHAFRVHASNPITLDPTMSGDSSSVLVISQLFSGLVDLSPDLGVVPDIAQDWEISQEGRRYLFHLREDVRWSDGTPVMAEDFEYSWKRMLDPALASPMAHILYDIKGAKTYHQEGGRREDVGVRALDKHTLVVELEEPTGYFLYLLRWGYPVPRHVVEEYGEKWIEMAHLVTNGPFRLESWQPEEAMTFSRNPEYSGRFTGNLQQVELTLLPLQEWAARLAMYEASDVDVLEIFYFPPGERGAVQQEYAGEYVVAPALGIYYVEFDTRQPPFDDVRVRRAFVLALDREKTTAKDAVGFWAPATGGFIPAGMPGHSPGIGLSYDPDQARRLLAEAGYPDGRGFPAVDLMLPAGPAAFAWAERVQTEWQENLGVAVRWEALEMSQLLEQREQESPHLLGAGWSPDYPDPDNFLRIAVKSADLWTDAAYFRLVEKARRVVDQEERMHLYRQADKILMEEAVIMPTAYYRTHLLVKPWVTQYPVPLMGVGRWKDIVIEAHG